MSERIGHLSLSMINMFDICSYGRNEQFCGFLHNCFFLFVAEMNCNYFVCFCFSHQQETNFEENFIPIYFFFIAFFMYALPWKLCWSKGKLLQEKNSNDKTTTHANRFFSDDKKRNMNI